MILLADEIKYKDLKQNQYDFTFLRMSLNHLHPYSLNFCLLMFAL